MHYAPADSKSELESKVPNAVEPKDSTPPAPTTARNGKSISGAAKRNKASNEAKLATATHLARQIFSHHTPPPAACTNCASLRQQLEEAKRPALPCANCAVLEKTLQEMKQQVEIKDERINDLESSVRAKKRVIKDILAEQKELRKRLKSTDSGTLF